MVTIIEAILAMSAFALAIFGYLDKRDNRLKYILFAQALILGTYFWMNESYSAALITLVIAPMNFMAAQRFAKKLYPLLAAIVLIAGLLGYSNIGDVFPIIAVSTSLYALYRLEGIKMRATLMFCSMMWIIHDVLYQMPIILCMDIMILALNIVGIIRIIANISNEVDENDRLIGTRGISAK